MFVFDFIIYYFEGKGPNEKIFEESMFNNIINFHKLRAEGFKKYYDYLVDRIENEPGFQEWLIDDLTKKWNLYNIDHKTGKSKPLDPKIFDKNYILRGKCRKLAKEKGVDARINRLEAMAVSID